MLISIFTPTHDPSFLPQVYESLRAQTNPNWEWVVVFNGGARPLSFPDRRVKIYTVACLPPFVGALKAFACSLATGDILLELDHDDLLLPTALEEIATAFSDSSTGFVYSNSIHSTSDFKPTPRYEGKFGWRYREAEFQGHKLDEVVSFDPTPEVVSRIWYAPNHLRAFRRDLYDRVGGYNASMRVLDDLDLMCRMYCETKFTHIDKGLYVYRIHGENSYLKHNVEIQQNVYQIYDRYIERMTEKAAKERGLRLIEVGGRMFARPGYETVDLKNADICCDLNNPWPFSDSSIGVIRSFDTFEHLRDSIHTMKEVSRVLVPGGWLFCQVPSTDGRGAFQDPTHVSFWNENSFQYYTRSAKAKYIDTPVRFQSTRLYTTSKDAEQVCWVRAHLLNLKDGYRPCGRVEI